MLSGTAPDGPSPPSPALPTEAREEDPNREVIFRRLLRNAGRATTRQSFCDLPLLIRAPALPSVRFTLGSKREIARMAGPGHG